MMLKMQLIITKRISLSNHPNQNIVKKTNYEDYTPK